MPGEVQQIAESLWLIEGGCVEEHFGFPEAANALLYQGAQGLYLLDSGLGEVVRAAIEELMMSLDAPRAFTLLNTGSGIESNGNNDIIHNVLAEYKEHRAWTAPAAHEAYALAERLYAVSRFVDPFRAVDSNGMRQFGLCAAREVLAAFFGQRTALRWMMSLFARRWPLVNPSMDTLDLLSPEEIETLTVGAVSWQGWKLGDVWALRAGNRLWCYLPVEKVLFAPDWGDVFAPAWLEDAEVDRAALLEKLAAMTRAGAVAVLAGAAQAEALRGQEDIIQAVEQLKSQRQGLQQALEAVLHREPGMTARALTRRLGKLGHRPAVAWYMDAPLPAGMVCFEQFLVGLLLEIGCEARGVWRRKKFYFNV
jgi:hypothetical protein